MIRRCPFCGSGNQSLRRGLHARWHARVDCMDCKAQGPEATEQDAHPKRISTEAEIVAAENEAIRLWNERK